MAINKTASLVFTGTRRFWDVPDIVESGTITYSISGGGGGTGGNDAQVGRSGSSAGYVRGTFTIAAKQRITVGVGGAGGNGASGASAVGGSGGQSLTGFSGGFGGKSGQFGSSGAGGGGGGATVIKIGETLIAVAAGGGGGGGGGFNSGGGFGGAGKNVDNFLGQNGAPHNGDGGGGGGGGGGWNAGAGGEAVSGDVGGAGGYQGTSAGLNSTVVTFVEDTRATIDTRVTTTTAGYAGGVVFDSVDLARLGAAAGAADHYQSTNSAYNAFLNSHGVWYGDQNGGPYDRTWVVNFPVSGNYLFQAAWDNAGRISVDGASMVERFTGDDAGTFQNVTEETKYIQAGFRNVRMYADNYGGPGSIGCVITGLPVAQTTTTTGEIVTTGSITTRNQGVGPGVSGYADMYLTARLSRGIQVKVNGQWTTAKDIYTKIEGAWKKTSQVYVKVDGDWKPAFIRGGDNLIRFEFTSTSDGFGNSTGASASATSGGGEPAPAGGGSCKIICQKLAEMGFFDKSMNEADQKFGRILRDQDPDAYNGYIRWAQPVVELLEGKGSATFRKVAFFWVRDEKRRQEIQSNIVAHYLDVIARPWAEEMAYRMKAEGYDKSNPAGRFIMNIGLPMCRSIGRFNKHRESPMWLKTALIWGITTVLLVAVSAISMIDKAFNKICKIFGRS